MSSRGLANLLVIPSALRPALLQAALAANCPPSALLALGTPTPWQTRSYSKKTTSSKPSKAKAPSRSNKTTPSQSSKSKPPTRSRNTIPSKTSRAAPPSRSRNTAPSKTSRAAPPSRSKNAIPSKSSRAAPSSRSRNTAPLKSSRAAPSSRSRNTAPSKSSRVVPPSPLKKTTPSRPPKTTPPSRAPARAPPGARSQARSHLDGFPPTLSFLPTPAHVTPPRALVADPPPESDLARSAGILHSPEFLYSAPRFLNLPINTRMPEVCLLGRSNVGKSTLINAIAGYAGGEAGTAHGSANVRKGLAITSARAGCTKTMNAYGFGVPLKVRPLTKQQQSARKEGGRARADRRAAGLSNKRGAIRPEGPPMHSLVLMDMPGYGLNSRADWGEEILKYIARREMLRGAVLLIDAVAGVKPGDRTVLEVLRDAGLKTRVVLTKADKIVSTVDPEVWRDSGVLREACLHVWHEIRRVERQGDMDWFEGEGWTPEIFVTGAGDPKMGGMGVDGARLAICRLAGHVAEPVRQLEATPQPEVVPYDQLVYAPSPPVPRYVAPAKPAVEVGGDQLAFAPSTPAPRYVAPAKPDREFGGQEKNRVPVGRGITRPWRAPRAPAEVDPMKQMEAAIQRPTRRNRFGQASF